VVDDQHRVVAGSATADRLTPLLRPAELSRALAGEAVRVPGARVGLAVPATSDEIAALAITINAMLDRLERSDKAQRRMGSDAAHELRSPLASIRTQLEVAERLGEGGALPAELLVDVDRLSRLVEDLLLLARADADTRGPARTSRVDAAALLDEVAARTPARVPVTVRHGPSAPVLADPEELRRVLQNLLDNAVRHAASGVELAAEVDAGVVRLLVRDDGPGLPVEERERVFERFTRRDDARSRDVGGTGLGLPIARELAARAGGTVRLDDAAEPWSLQAVLELPAGRAAT